MMISGNLNCKAFLHLSLAISTTAYSAYTWNATSIASGSILLAPLKESQSLAQKHEAYKLGIFVA
jgi:hypothetical protein